MALAAAMGEAATPVVRTTPPPRQKRRPNSSGARHGQPPLSTPARPPIAPDPGSATLNRRVSFDVQPRRTPASAPLARHASFDPRAGRRDGGGSGGHRSHRSSGSVASTSGSHSSRRSGSGSGGSSDAAWAKLVARTQTLEEDLASERASKRLLAVRMAQEKQAALDQLAKSEEEHKGLQELWKHTNEKMDDMQKQLQLREAHWKSERASLHRELERLRLAAGEPPLPSGLPAAVTATASPGSASAEDAISGLHLAPQPTGSAKGAYAGEAELDVGAPDPEHLVLQAISPHISPDPPLLWSTWCCGPAPLHLAPPSPLPRRALALTSPRPRPALASTSPWPRRRECTCSAAAPPRARR